jgi:hypothetical protein
MASTDDGNKGARRSCMIVSQQMLIMNRTHCIEMAITISATQHEIVAYSSSFNTFKLNHELAGCVPSTPPILTSPKP